jgi:hypothetical protein
MIRCIPETVKVSAFITFALNNSFQSLTRYKCFNVDTAPGPYIDLYLYAMTLAALAKGY